MLVVVPGIWFGIEAAHILLEDEVDDDDDDDEVDEDPSTHEPGGSKNKSKESQFS